MAIVNCTSSVCRSEYQDKKYGKGKRVANRTNNQNYRCTVCLATVDEDLIDKSFTVREEE